jgi:hypothetical protein
MTEYNAQLRGVQFAVIGRFELSSKTSSEYGQTQYAAQQANDGVRLRQWDGSRSEACQEHPGSGSGQVSAGSCNARTRTARPLGRQV